MRTSLFRAATAALVLGALAGPAGAADHRDGPGILVDPTVDITDLYAWMSADASKVYLVLDLQGANTGPTTTTKFSNSALYVFHVTSGAKYGDTAKGDTIVCKFDAQAAQGFQCWGPSGEYVTGTVGDKNGSLSSSGKVRAAALVRDDPFWFNIRGFLSVAGVVKQQAGVLTFDSAGCPNIDQGTSGVLVGLLKSDGKGGAAADDFGKSGKAPVACVPGKCDPTAVTNGNVLSIVLAVDKSLLTAGGPIVSVWASTNMAK